MKKTARTSKSKRDLYGLRLVQADVTLRSASGKSIHDKGAQITAKNVHEYYPPEGVADRAEEILHKLGLRSIAKNRITICIAAPLDDFQRVFGVRLTMKRVFPYVMPKGQRRADAKGCGIELFHKRGKKLPVPEELLGLVESIRLATPAKFCAPPSADPPTPGYFHLKVPGDVSRLVDAEQCHNHGLDGSSTMLVMPDQGTFDHPYYAARGYDITLDSSAYDGTADTGSHGTAIAANALAVAPNVKFIGVRNGKKISSGTAAFVQAASYNPDVISVSWGTDSATADVANLRAAIAQAVADGITVCAACGNGGTVVFPSSMSDVISVGGTYADALDGLQASPYASSGVFAGDPGRQMPDLTGFVGPAPSGVYITMPCHPGSDEDKAFGGGAFPDKDETPVDDGWLVASGTSSATPQVAAVACLLIQSDPTFRRRPDLIKQRLMQTALDVEAGSTASGDPAAVGPDNATGAGVVDAFLAVNRVDVWLRDNENDRGLVPARGVNWLSPDIKVLAGPLVNPDAGFDAATHVDRPVYGTSYYAYIKARNRGVLPANNVSVGFFYADPSTYISYPADWRDGQSGVPEQGAVTVDGLATNQFLIPTIPPKSARVAGPFLWRPPAPAAATQTASDSDGRIRGHFCLLARLECDSDPITYVAGGWPAVSGDNNIALKNVWVVEPEVTFPLFIGKVPKYLGVLPSRIKVAVEDPLESMVVEMRIPRRAVRVDALRKAEIAVRESRQQKGMLYLSFGGSRRDWVFDVSSEERLLLLCVVHHAKPRRSRTAVRGKLPREASINIHQLAGETLLGGASVRVAYASPLRRRK